MCAIVSLNLLIIILRLWLIETYLSIVSIESLFGHCCPCLFLRMGVFGDLDFFLHVLSLSISSIKSVPLCWSGCWVVCLVQCTFITDLIICMCVWWSCLPYEVLSFVSASLNRFLIGVPVPLLMFPHLSIVICYWLPLFMAKLECFCSFFYWWLF